MKHEIKGLANGDWSLCVDEKLVWSCKRYVTRGNIIGEVQSPTFEGENPKFGLNWLCLTIVFL